MGEFAGKSAVGVITSVADAKPASLRQVNTLLARAEHEIKDIREAPCMQNLMLCAPVAINDGNPDEAERLAKLALEELPPRLVLQPHCSNFGAG